jgi:archaellum biogenesis protein FlaJ (TadC family)
MAVKYGLGRHLVYLSEHELNMTLYWSTILQPMGVYSYCFPKLAVVLLLVKLMVPTKRVSYALYGLMAVLFVCSFLAVLFLFVRCTPRDHFWHPLEPATCMPASVLNGLTALAGCKYLDTVICESVVSSKLTLFAFP